MARTRAQDKAGSAETKAPVTQKEPKKRPHSKTQEPSTASEKRTAKKPKTVANLDGTAPRPKSNVKDQSAKKPSTKPSVNSPVLSLIQQYGSIPLSETDLADPSSPQSETMLALLLNAMLSSARISHDLAAKTTKRVIESRYHQLDVLKASSWQERTEVLTKGGYTRYREKTATSFGELADFLEAKYDGDLNNVLQSTGKSPRKIRDALKEIKGLGDVGVDIFFDTAQGLWPCLAPFLDPRSAKTAEAIGISSDAAELWHDVGQDAMQMCKLAGALTRVRLEKREGEF